LLVVVGAGLVGVILVLQDRQAVGEEPYFEQFLIMDAIAALVLAPLFITIYLSLREIVNRLLIRLDDNGVIGPAAGGMTLKEFARDLDCWLHHPRVWAPTAGATGVYFLYTLWDSLNEMDSLLARFLIASTLVTQTALFFLGVLAIFQLGVACWRIGWLLRNSELRTQALHPDGCGGLRAVGHLLTVVLSTAAILGAASLGMFLAIKATPAQPTRRPEPYVLAFLYVVLLPLAFLNLLWWPHQGMDSYRKQVLKPVVKKFHESIILTWPSTTDDSARLKANNDSLSEITRQFQVLDDALPVWPLRLRRLQAVLAAAILPVLIPVVTAVLLRMLGP
jgi:hypothetical protein